MYNSQMFRFGSVDHLIDNFPKSPKYNKNQQNTVCFNARSNRASKKNPRTVMMITIKRYMHLCLVMTKVLVEILVKVCNRPIEF